MENVHGVVIDESLVGKFINVSYDAVEFAGEEVKVVEFDKNDEQLPIRVENEDGELTWLYANEVEEIVE